MHCVTCKCGAPKRTAKAKAPTPGAKMTPALAAKLRRANAEQCGCVLCTWAINPAMTIAEHEARLAETATRNAGGTWPVHKTWAALGAAA